MLMMMMMMIMLMMMIDLYFMAVRSDRRPQAQTTYLWFVVR